MPLSIALEVPDSWMRVPIHPEQPIDVPERVADALEIEAERSLLEQLLEAAAIAAREGEVDLAFLRWDLSGDAGGGEDGSGGGTDANVFISHRRQSASYDVNALAADLAATQPGDVAKPVVQLLDAPAGPAVFRNVLHALPASETGEQLLMAATTYYVFVSDVESIECNFATTSMAHAETLQDEFLMAMLTLRLDEG
jgi:hypothetical protein